MLIVLLPWGIRNKVSLGHFILTRTNLNLELWLSYHPDASVDMEPNARRWHPYANRTEALAVKTLGEVEYNRRKLPELVGWVKQSPLHALRLIGERILLYWFHWHKSRLHTLVDGLFMVPVLAGFLLVWKRCPAFGLYALAMLAIYPLIYYLLQATPRYRLPIEWLLVMLAGTAVSEGLVYMQGKAGFPLAPYSGPDSENLPSHTRKPGREHPSVSFRQGCVRRSDSRFLLGQEAADRGSADFKLACDLGFADALPV